MTLPKIFHAMDVKDYLGISLNKTYQILESGELRATKCGSRWLVTETALSEYLGLQTEGGTNLTVMPPLESVDRPAALRGDRCG